MASRSILALILWLVAALTHGVEGGDQARPLSLGQAVHAAERFIALNGYTDVPPTKDRRSLSYETIERARTVAQLLRWRHNTLERRAYGYANHGKGDQPGWTIVFRYTKPRLTDKTGRAVTMDLDGGNMRVEHMDAILAAFHRLGPPE